MVKRSFGSEALLPLAEGRGITIETNGEVATTIGAPALLLPMTTNLVHNAIVHNHPDHGSVWVTTSVQSTSTTLTVENTGDRLSPQLVATLAEPFRRGQAYSRRPRRCRPGGWRSSSASPRHTAAP